MAKGSRQKTNKNVFKVAGARSLKAKNKAKAVSTQVKKLTQVTKQKTVEVDNLLSELQDTVRQSQPEKKSAEKEKSHSESKAAVDTRQEKIQKYKKTEENSAQALEKLNKMEV